MIWFSSFFKTTSGIIINNAIGFNWETIIQNNTIKKVNIYLSNTRVELILKAFSATQASVSVNMKCLMLEKLLVPILSKVGISKNYDFKILLILAGIVFWHRRKQFERALCFSLYWQCHLLIQQFINNRGESIALVSVNT